MASPQASQAACYCVAPGLKLRSWPGEDVAAAWVPGSVNTHLVSALAAGVLVAARHGHWSTEAITTALLANDAAVSAEVLGFAEALPVVAGVVSGLVQVGLLRPTATLEGQ